MSLRFCFPYFICACLGIPAFAQGTFAIQNVSVITMANETVLNNHTVIVEDGVIVKVAPTSKAKLPKKTKVIDGSGKFLIPGLFDMHAHFFMEQGEHINTNKAELKLMLANGITTARIMAGHPAFLEAKFNVKSGKWIGPELSVASPQFVGRWPFAPEFKNYEVVASEAKANEAVKKFKADGYDAIKLTFMMAKPIYKAVNEAAARENIKVVGHVGPIVMLPAALEAKQQIEHMDMFIETLLPDTSYNHGQSVSDYNIYSKAAWETVPHLMESKISPLAKMVKDAGVYVTPTNYFFISSFGFPLSDEEVKSKPDYDYLPSTLKQEKWKYRENYLKKMASLESREKYVKIRQQMVFELWQAGVPLMAGSDAPEFFQVTGFALHDELKTMVDAGLTPYAALQTATINPATFLGMIDRTGTIEVGKEADLVLLDKNPLEDITNTRTIVGVGEGQEWVGHAALKSLLAESKLVLSK
ncbi:MAG TPA: amidohydrolase family protein [Chryseosolibacter sp.]